MIARSSNTVLVGSPSQRYSFLLRRSKRFFLPLITPPPALPFLFPSLTAHRQRRGEDSSMNRVCTLLSTDGTPPLHTFHLSIPTHPTILRVTPLLIPVLFSYL